MASDWEKVTLVDHCQKIGSGATPRGGSSVYLEEGEIALIRSQNIYNEGFSRDGLVYITVDAAEKLKNVIVEEDDILLNITGDSVARVCMVDNSYLPARVNQHVSIIRPKAESFNAKFLRYYLTSPYMQQLMLNYSSAGATRKALTKSMIENLEVLKPSIDIQNNIAHILGTLDDKIELNRQINETLEAMAQALFKSWFVDFDPVIDNALLAGKAIPEPLKERAEIRQAQLDSGKAKINSEINDLFPSEFEFTEELGWIPKGWSVKSANEVANISIGKTPPRKQQEHFSKTKEDNFIWVSIRDMGENSVFIHDSSEYLTKNSVVKFNVKVVPKDSVILSFKLTLGRVLIADVDVTTNEAIAHFINPKFSMTKEYIYSYLKLFNYQLLGSTSSIATAVNSKIIKAIPFLVPHEDVLNHFKSESKDYFEKIRLNSLNTQTLAELRDTLLPKLMSGELRIADAEKLAENI